MKFTKNFKSFLFLLFLCFNSSAQTIKIYHGLKGTSKIIKDGVAVGQSEKFVFDEGKEITIEVINAHPALYTYTFNNEEIEIVEQESPDISSLIAFLSKDINNIPDSSKKVFFDSVEVNWPKEYAKKLNKLKDEIKKADSIINISDSPKNIKKALIYSNKKGFLYAKKELMKIKLFSRKDFDSYINNIKEEAKGTSSDFTERDHLESTLMELYDSFLDKLAAKIKIIRKSYGNDVSAVIKYKVTLNSKINKVTLSIKEKNSNINSREIGDDIITIEISPNYKRPVLELVPVVLMHKAKGGKNFGIENGILTESNREEFNFSVGATLNLNLFNWGKYKEFSFGTGLGFALTENTLDNFFLNANFNYKKWVRFGVGYGFLRTPTGLKDNLKAGDSAANISNISDVITFQRQPALFFTIVIPGLTIPLN